MLIEICYDSHFLPTSRIQILFICLFVNDVEIEIKVIIIVIQYSILLSALKFVFEHLRYYLIRNIHSVD